MCGICGVWGGVAQERVQHMMQLQAHRGPDGQGMHMADGQAGMLGHKRLSIMDPVGGRQPIYNEGKTAVIIANGEIYNHRVWRQRLEVRHDFVTTSDTETILHLFEELGVESAQNLDGMFALAIVDESGLFLARDPIGTVDLLPQLIQEATASIDVSAYTTRYVVDRIRSAEECFYHHLLVDGFHRPRVVLENVGRWGYR